MSFQSILCKRNENVTTLIKESLKFNKIIKMRINNKNNNNEIIYKPLFLGSSNKPNILLCYQTTLYRKQKMHFNQ